MEYRGLHLDPFQEEAIVALEAGESVLVSAPTGTGKTVVADWMVEKVLSSGHEVVYTAPIKALSNQKFRDYCKLFGEDKVGLVTGDLVIRRDAPCRVMTTEILRNMLLTGEEIPDLRAVVVDEIHFLDDEERGTVWEEVLIYLHQRVQIVGLSATLSNLHQFAEWLTYVRERPVRVIEEYERAVPLGFRVASREGGLKTPDEMNRFFKRWMEKNAYAVKRAESKESSRGGKWRGRREREKESRVGGRTRHRDVFRLLWPDSAPYLYFTFSRRDAEGMARALARGLMEPLIEPYEMRQVEKRLDLFREEPGGDAALDEDLSYMLRGGIGFHHAGLHVSLKALIEELYERKLIKVLYCTGTFALGINMPARTAVFDGLMRFNGKEMISLPGREFMQMAGRAGRRGMDEEGLVVVRCDIDDWPEIAPQLKLYLKGQTEPVRSRFSLSFNSVVNLVERHPPERIRWLVERSFLAWYRARRAEKDAERVDEIRERLAGEGWEPGQKAPKHLKQDLKHLRRLEDRAAEGTERTWNEFQEKVRFLERWGYIEEGGAFNAGAKVLRHVQISEVFVTEIFLAGIFDELDMPDLFGVLCGICAALPRGANVSEGRRWKKLGNRIEQIRRSEIVTQAEVLSKQELTWDPEMIPFGRWWAEGRPLSELMMQMHSATDVSGDLVGAFRRAKDLAGQLRGAWADFPEQVARVDALIRKVTRDEVEVVD